MSDLIGWELDELLPHIEDDLRTGAFEMNEYTVLPTNGDWLTYAEAHSDENDEETGIDDDEYTKVDHECGICGRHYCWSTDDISWEYEKSQFMPCGDKWEFLDRVVE